jgi:hypothetical protein
MPQFCRSEGGMRILKVSDIRTFGAAQNSAGKKTWPGEPIRREVSAFIVDQPQ